MRARALLLAFASIPFSSWAPAAPQDAPEVTDERPEIQALLDKLAGHVKERGTQDTEAVGVIDQLLQEFPKCGLKDREAVVEGLDECFEAKRGESEEGVPDNRLYIACAVSLREMAPESAPVLMKWIGHKSHRKDVALQVKLIQSLGKTQDEKGRKLLIKTLVDKTPAIQAAASEALGEFGEAVLEIRKENFDELLKLLMSVKGLVDSDPNDIIARERYDTISAPIISSLSRLSGQKIHDPNEWQRWWNKNKKEDWGAIDG
jgi:hypothetical protein